MCECFRCVLVRCVRCLGCIRWVLMVCVRFVLCVSWLGWMGYNSLGVGLVGY